MELGFFGCKGKDISPVTNSHRFWGLSNLQYSGHRNALSPPNVEDKNIYIKLNLYFPVGRHALVRN
jgi:hypothetical protein